jgi:long-chain fatty acid transport protein
VLTAVLEAVAEVTRFLFVSLGGGHMLAGLMKVRFLPLAILAGLVPSAFGSGVRIVHQDAEATARGDAFVATADNASAIFYNPAGITQLEGVHARVGSYLVTIQEEYRPETGGSFDNKDRLIVIPNAYYTWSPKDSKLSLGIGVSSPFGLALEYPDDAPSRDANKKAKLAVIALQPVFAWQICETLSFGIGPTINYGAAQDFRGLGVRGDGFAFKGAGMSYGFNAGILWKPTPQHAFGLTYHSPLDFDFSGHFRVTLKPFAAQGDNQKVRLPEEDATLSIELPQFIVAGYSFRPTPEWNMEVNVEWTDWDRLDSGPLKLQTSPPSAIRFDWRSGFIYSAGITRKFSNGIHISAGYSFSEGNNPESTYTPGVPDGDRNIVSIGIGRRGERFDWDIGYQYSRSDTREIDNDGPADGRWQLQSHAVMVSVGYHF